MKALTNNDPQRVGSFLRHGDAPLQLGLSLSGGSCDVPASSAPSSGRFTEQGLVVEKGGVRRVYGFWSTMFGCWETDLVTGRTREIIPNDVLPSERDIQVCGDSERLDRVRARTSRGCRKSGFEARIAMAAFLADVPVEIRQLTGSFGPLRWLALDLIWQVPGFADFLETETAQGHRPYVHACLALANASALSRAGRCRLGRAIMTAKRADLLAQLSGCAWPTSAVAALYKLEAGDLEASAYRNLARAMTVPSAAKVLSHVRNIDAGLPGLLLRLPNVLHLPGLFRLCGNGMASWTLMARVFDVMKVQRSVDRPGCLQALVAVHEPGEFEAWRWRWRSIALDRQPFPPPPFAGDDLLRPIADNEDLRREGRCMGNCVAELAGSVLDGEAYFYHWAGKDPATVMLENDEERGWILGEALGLFNQALCAWTRYLIRRRIWTWRFHLLGVRGDPAPRIPGYLTANASCPLAHGNKPEGGIVNA
ncbi:MAG: hypothetical protein RBS99_14715 [Rhodospirillales bacterium]|jgi:hypothetical protein|nr:hypothetical protein [Rhodospirillales bacterium]